MFPEAKAGSVDKYYKVLLTEFYISHGMKNYLYLLLYVNTTYCACGDGAGQFIKISEILAYFFLRLRI